MTDEEFRLDVVVRDGRQWVVVHGELDLATAPLLDEAFADRLSDPGPSVVVDLERCTFMDSSGVRAIVRFGSRAAREGRPVAIVAAPGSPSRFTLDLLGVGDAIPLHDSAERLLADGDRADSA